MLKNKFFKKDESTEAVVRDALKRGKDEINVIPRDPSEAMAIRETLERRGFSVMIEDDGGKLTLSASRLPPKSAEPLRQKGDRQRAAHGKPLSDTQKNTRRTAIETTLKAEDKHEGLSSSAPRCSLPAESDEDEYSEEPSTELPSGEDIKNSLVEPSGHTRDEDKKEKHLRDSQENPQRGSGTIEHIANSAGYPQRGKEYKTAVIFSCALAETERHLCDMTSRSYLDAILKQENIPDILILKDNAVKLALFDSSACDRLKNIERRGTRILICGTAANYFGITEKIGVGIISSPLEILEAVEEADKVINI